MKFKALLICLFLFSSLANAGFDLGDLKKAAKALDNASKQKEAPEKSNQSEQTQPNVTQPTQQEPTLAKKPQTIKPCIDDDSMCIGDELSTLKVNWIYSPKPSFDSNTIYEKRVAGMMSVFPFQNAHVYAKLYKHIDERFTLHLTNEAQSILPKLSPICRFVIIEGEYLSKNNEKTKVDLSTFTTDYKEYKWVVTKIKREYSVKTDMGAKIIIDKLKQKYGSVSNRNNNEYGIIESTQYGGGLDIEMKEPLSDTSYDERSIKYQNSSSCTVLDENAEKTYLEAISILEKNK